MRPAVHGTHTLDPRICRQWGGDPGRIVLTGYSRGAIACNYIGLHDDQIAKLWRAIIAASHYDDGHIAWGMTPEEQRRAPERLRRLGATPQFICGEYCARPQQGSDAKLRELIKERNLTTFTAAKEALGLVPITEVEGTRTFIEKDHPQGRYTFVHLPWVNHGSQVFLRDTAERRRVREWLREVLDAATIENEFCAVEFDAGRQTFSVRHKPTQRVFARNGTFVNSGGKVRVIAAEHPTFGRGQAIEIVYANGDRNRLAIYPNLEFVLFTGWLRNGGSESRIVDKVPLFTATLDAGRPPNDLRVSGSRGNLPAPGGTDASFSFAAVVDPPSRRGAVGGWLTHDRGSGSVLTPLSADKQATLMQPQIDYGRLPIVPGAEVTTETFSLGWFEDARLGLEAYADAVKDIYCIRLPKPPVGLCTWYMEKNQFSCSEKELPKLIEAAARELKPFGFDFIQLDDGWQAGESHFSGPRKQFLNVNQGAFPSGTKATADGIKAAGLTPGIWFIPFAGDSQDPYFAPHHDWFVKRQRDGKPFDAYWGGTCLDMTHDGARDYLRRIVSTLGHDWGYTFFKMDGLFTGIGVDHVEGRPHFDDLGGGILANPAKTQIEAYREGLKLVRETAGKDVFLLGCNIPQNMRSFGGSFSLVDAMRIGPDTGGATGAGPGSRVWFLNGRVWWNDPDCVLVRPDKGSLNWARRNATWPAIAGQLFYVSDWLPDLPAERMEILKRCIPSHGLTTARPVDVLETWMPQVWLLTDTREKVRRDVVAIYKWWGDSGPFSITAERLGLPAAKEYVGFDFWANKFVPPFKDSLSIVLEADSCVCIAVRPVSDVPQLISTSRHVTQGIVDVAGETWDAANKTLSGVSTVVGNDPYEVRVAMPASGAWQATSVNLSAEGVKASMAADGTNRRVTLNSATSRPVRWSVRFTNK